jgi:tetrahydromethanopterin S-methyltransferase subunit A
MREQTLTWDDDVRQVIEKETIYLRERLRTRVESLVREAGRQHVTLADLEEARRVPAGMGMGGKAADPVAEPAWPVTFGTYQLIDPEGTVAICTLASEMLMDRLAAAQPSGVAIVGRAFTENFGVEKVVTNVVANPHIRTLVLCGVESRHRVGQTLLALHEGGVDDAGRVVGSLGPQPVVRSLTPGAVHIYRQKLTLIDLRGADEPAAILESVRGAVEVAPAPWSEHWVPPIPVERLGGGASTMGGRFTPDPTGLFLIGVGPSGRTIHVEHYTREGVLDRRVIGESAQAICQALAAHELFGHTGHAAYIGRELQKAELAVRLGLSYEQDRDLDVAGLRQLAG